MRFVVERGEVSGWARIGNLQYGLASLDVLRTVAEALAHLDGKASLVERAHPAVGAIAPAVAKVKAEQADFAPSHEAGCHRIVGHGARGNAQCCRIGRSHEAFGPCQHGGHRPPAPVGGGDEKVRQRREEAAVLPGHEGPDGRTIGGLTGKRLG